MVIAPYGHNFHDNYAKLSYQFEFITGGLLIFNESYNLFYTRNKKFWKQQKMRHMQEFKLKWNSLILMYPISILVDTQKYLLNNPRNCL